MMNDGADICFVHLGIAIDHLQKSITVFGFPIAFYGMIIGCGMLAGLFLAQSDAKRRGQDPELYLDFALYAIIFAIIGARTYYVLFEWDDLRRSYCSSADADYFHQSKETVIFFDGRYGRIGACFGADNRTLGKLF